VISRQVVSSFSGHGEIKRQERLAALGFAADDADGLLGPFLGSAPAELPSSRPHIQIADVSSGSQDRPPWAAEGLVLTAASTAAHSNGTGRG
jgi:hypothetical protein